MRRITAVVCQLVLGASWGLAAPGCGPGQARPGPSTATTKRGKPPPRTQKPTGPALKCPARVYRDDVLAQVGCAVVTVRQFQESIHRQSPWMRRRYTLLVRKKEYLEREFIMPLIEDKEALRRGLDKDAYVRRTHKNLMVSKLMRQLRTEFKTAEPSDAELRAFYKKHADDYNQPELVRASHILLKVKATAVKVARAARGKSRVEFRRLVQKHSVDEATKSRAGDLRYFDRKGKVRGLVRGAMSKVPKALVDAAWPLKKPGTVVGPIKTRLGWHVLYFTGRRPARKQSFGQARLHVKKRVMRDKWQKKKQGFLRGLETRFRVTRPTTTEMTRRLGLVKVTLSDSSPDPALAPNHATLVLARVGRVVITVGAVTKRINHMSAYVRQRYTVLAKQRYLLESMIEFELLAAEAKRRGLDKHEDVRRMLRSVRIQQLRHEIARRVKRRGDDSRKLRTRCRAAIDAFRAALRKNARVKIYLERLAAVPIDTRSLRP